MFSTDVYQFARFHVTKLESTHLRF